MEKNEKLMKTVKDSADKSELRRQAEEKLKEATSGSEDLSGVSPERMTNLIHELQVHQIELKMQNDELRRIQGALERTRDKYSHLYDFAPVGYFTMSEKGIIEEVNLTGAAMIGIERSALIGKPFTRLVLRDDQDIFYKHRERLLETETSQSCELRLINKDGHKFYAGMKCMVIKNKGGDLRQIRTVVSDITEHKRAEEALRESEERFRTAFENAAAGMALMANDGYFLEVNQTLCKILGYSEEELLRKTWVEITEPEDLDGCYDWLKRIKTGEESAYEKRFIHKLGHQVWVMVSSSLVRDSQGKIRYYISLFQDIMSRKQAEEALRESEFKFRNLFDLSPQAVSLTEVKTGKLVDINDKFCELTQYSKEDLIGKTTSDAGFYSVEDRSIFTEELQASGEVEGLEMDFKAKDGSIITALMFARVINIAGKPLILTVFNDVTTQKQLEDQLRQSHKMEAIGTLAGGIAHEFNNILGIIIGNTELAIDDVPEWNPAKDCLEEIRSASLRAKDVVRHILSFARKSHIERKPVPISPIIRDTFKLLRASLPSSIDIRQDFSCEHGTVLADPVQINQVLVNICTNSAHAMREQGGVLDVKLEDVILDEETVAQYEVLSPGNYVKLTVKDSGHGIKPENIDRIFDPYFTTKGVGEGTGMGLSVVHGIVKSHDGAITVYSELGKGTVVEVLLPITEDEIEPQVVEPDDLPKGDERILLVDDEEALIRAYTLSLRSLGYEVVSFTNPNKALNAFKDQPAQFDLVISDMTMLQMTGDKLAKKLMEIRPDIPIIISTGFSEKMDENKAKEIGIRAVAMKPLVMRTLALTIRKVLDEK